MRVPILKYAEACQIFQLKNHRFISGESLKKLPLTNLILLEVMNSGKKPFRRARAGQQWRSRGGLAAGGHRPVTSLLQNRPAASRGARTDGQERESNFSWTRANRASVSGRTASPPAPGAPQRPLPLLQPASTLLLRVFYVSSSRCGQYKPG